MIPAIQELNFPKIDGKQYATLSHATVNLADMGEKTISTQVRIDGEIVPDFSYDWAVEFQGEKYIMPLRIPQGAKENTSLNSTIDLTFQHWAIWQLKRWTFVTMQPIDTGTAVADEEVATVQLNLKDFCDLFGQVLRYYYGDTITIDLNPAWQYDNAPTAIEINHSYIWNVLIDAFHDKYGVRWAIEPREDNDNTVKGGERYVIKIGYPTTEVDHIFEYGFEGGLLKLERQVQSEDIHNMIKGRGGDTNIPFRYFKDTDPGNPDFESDPDWVEELKNIYFTNLMPATYRSYIQGWKAAHISKYPGYKAVGENNAYSPWAYRKGFTDTKFHPVEFVADEITLNPQEGDRQVQIFPDYAPFVKKGSSIDVYGPLSATLDNNEDICPTIQGTGLDIAVDVEQIESDDVAESVESDAVVSNVGAAKATATNVVKSAYKSLTIRGAYFSVDSGKTANFSEDAKILSVTSGGKRVDANVNAEITEKNVNIYNAVTGEKWSASGIPSGRYYYEIVVEVHNLTTDKTLNITVGTESPKLESATIVDDKWKNTFDIWVKDIWSSTRLAGETDSQYSERVWKPILGDRDKNTAKVVFTSGMLLHEDYEFTIVDFPVPDTSKTYTDANDIRHDSYWRITLAKSDAELEATGLYVPSTQKQGKAGDTFAFIGTEMTHVPYVVDAEIRLDDWKKDHLGEVKEIKPTFVVTTDRVRLNNEGKPDALINQLRVGNSLRIADKRFIQPMSDRAYETLYLQSLTYTYREPSSDDAALNPDVEIVLSNEYTTSANPVSVMQGEISSMQRLLGSISNVEQIVRAVGDKLYLRKDGISDRSLSPTQFFSLLTSGDFRAGLVGGAGWGFYKDENDNWVLEADRVNVRQEISANTLIVNQAEGRGGMEIDTAAFMEVTRVVDTAEGYICYFDQKDGSVANLFQVDDVAFCNRWTPENQELKFYKRRVVAVGVDNITLSKTDVNGTGIPAEKDNIIHFGNYTDKTRQYVKVRDVVGGGYERYIENLDSVNAEGVEYYFVGKQAGESRWFVGNRDLVPYSGKGDGSYIEYINRRFNLNNVTLSVNTTIGDKTIEQYIQQVSPLVKQEDIEGFVNAIMDPKIKGIQNQIDGVIESFSGFGAPTLNNYPANEWTTDKARKVHERDTYTDKTEYVDDVTTPTAGQSWKWQYTSPTDYGWVKIADSDAVKALLDAAKAQDTADKKRRIFTEQPKPPYDEGDLWVNAEYYLGAGNYAYRDDILRCSAPKKEGQSFDIKDWEPASRYTDDTKANEALSSIRTYEYIKAALAQDTQISGGLMMTTLISLGYTDEAGLRHTLAGMNGSWIPKLGGRTIASWYGGEMVDLFDRDDNRVDPVPTNAATSLIRMDGSAYFANGNIGFRADGSGWLGNDTNGIRFGRDGSMTLGSGIKINLNGGDEGLKETVESLLNFNLGLSNLLKPCNANDEEISWEEAAIEGRAKSLKAKLGLWTDFFLSARGKNEAEGGGVAGGLDIAMLEDYLTDNKYATQPWVTSALGNYYSKAEADARFLRQHQSLSDYVTLNTVQTIRAAKTFTDELIATEKWVTAKIITGETGAANNTVQRKKAHGIELGYPNRDYMNFNEFGGVFNFYKTNRAYTAASGDGTLVASITENGITAASFIRQGGTSSQFLKADGSVDANTYLTSHQSLANYYTKSEVDAKDKRLVTYYPSRPTTANVNFGNNAGLYTFLATSSMTSGKPAGDGHILHMEWDNSLAWAGQIAVPNRGDMQWRYQLDKTWQAWRTILDSSNFDSLIGSGLTAYVKKAGDTMTGILDIKTTTQTLMRLDSTNNDSGICCRISGTNKAWIGYDGIHGATLYNYICAKYLGIKDNGTPHFQGNTLWHAGNDGAGSGLDADLLDGLHYSSFIFHSDSSHKADRQFAYGTSKYLQATSAWNANYLLLQDISTWNDTSTATSQVASFSGDICVFRDVGSAEIFRATVIAKVSKWGSGTGSRNYTLQTDNGSVLPCIVTYNSKTWLAVRLASCYSAQVRLMGVMHNLASSPFTCVEDNSQNNVSQVYSASVGLGNSGSAVKLMTPRTLWGQSFDGTGNVSGDMTGVGDINTAAAPIGTIYASNWFRSTGATGWYNVTYGGGWYMSDTTWIRINGGKSLYAGAGTIRTDYLFTREDYAGAAWSSGYGAYNVQIYDNAAQTPLLLAYRRGTTPAGATGADRLFSMELLNTGGELRFSFGGSSVFRMTKFGEFQAIRSVQSSAWFSDSGQIRANAMGTSYYLGMGAATDGYGVIQGGNSGTGAIPLLLNPKGGSVGIGLVPSFKFHVAGDIKANGGIYTGNLTAHNGVGGSGCQICDGNIELFGSLCYIDFHHGNTTTDYTSRIIELEPGVITIEGQLHVTGGIWTEGFMTARQGNRMTALVDDHEERIAALEAENASLRTTIENMI